MPKGSWASHVSRQLRESGFVLRTGAFDRRRTGIQVWQSGLEGDPTTCAHVNVSYDEDYWDMEALRDKLADALVARNWEVQDSWFNDHACSISVRPREKT